MKPSYRVAGKNSDRAMSLVRSSEAPPLFPAPLALPSDIPVRIDALPDLAVQAAEALGVAARFGQKHEAAVSHLHQQRAGGLDPQAAHGRFGRRSIPVASDSHAHGQHGPPS